MDKILVVDGVTREYPGRFAVQNCSFNVTKGSIHGFLGPNGAGKSTTMRMIAGLLPTTAGEIHLFGERMTPDNIKLKNRLGLLPENPPLYLDMKVRDYLEFVAKIHRVPDLQDKVQNVIKELSLDSVEGRLIGNLSKGYRQRVGLAQAIVYDAPFLILDEPTNGLDPQTVVELREFIKKLSQEKTILFSSHILSEVEQLCDHITIIHEGKIRASGNLHDIHQKFRQGLVLKIGLGKNEKLPDLSSFGKYKVTKQQSVGDEEQFHLIFEDDRDCRKDVSSFLVKNGSSLLTMQIESPELEDIFLHMTEGHS
jgi:ABC-2 type transport system ATP-binding protein